MNRILAPLWLLVGHLAVVASPADSGETVPLSESPRILTSTNYSHLVQVTPRIFSGSEPDGDAAFAELARLGIRSLISVDGAQPAIETARKHGLRYVHLPFGYDAIPSNRVAELVFAATEVPGPIYLHCHHGQHRGPAAVAIICLATEGWTPEQAIRWLRQAGTSPDYRGLYRAVTEFKPPTPSQLQLVQSLPEVSKASTLVEEMVALEEHWERLKQIRKNGWKEAPRDPDQSFSEEATLLWEHFQELRRLPENADRPVDYRDKLDSAEQAAQALRTALTAQAAAESLEAPFQHLKQSCTSCHQVYRN